MSKLRWLITGLARRLWVRASLFAVAGILTAIAAIALAPMIPASWSVRIGADSVGNVLQILASSMLAVTTFSLATMVSAYATASSATTPRVAELLIQDSSAQNALGTFIGSFLFSLVGIIALSAGVYGDSGRLVLFIGTIAIIAIIVITLLRWIDLLSRFGRVNDAIDRVESAAATALRTRHQQPCFGARVRNGSTPTLAVVSSARIGYLQHIDVEALERVAAAAGGEVHVEVLPGTFLDAATPLARLDFAADDEARQTVRDAFDVGPRRSFDQDPRFGIVVLSEIAAKALSPAVNDPGTAIATLAALVRVLAILAEPREETHETRYPHVFVPALSVDDLVSDAFSSISESGAGTLAVGIRLQKTLRSLTTLAHPELTAAARRQSALALERARHALPLAEDLASLERASRAV